MPVMLLFSFAVASPAFADGFSLDHFLKNEPHVILKLTDRQAERVGRLRRLELSSRQHALLREKSGKAPTVLGVQSPGEPDCSCHISSAFWLNDRRVVIWTERLKYDRDGSRYYHQVRRRPGRFVMDARGRLYTAGKEITFEELERRMAAPRNARTYFQVSLPPAPPPNAEEKLGRIKKKYFFNYRL